MADYVEIKSKKMPPWKTAIFIAAVFALVSLPFTRRLLERTIPALQDNTTLYLVATTLLVYITSLLIIQGTH
jgi:predicted PurR-regulated permease PerM